MGDSYSSTKLGLIQRLREYRELYRFHRRDVAVQVRLLIERLSETEELIRRHTGVTLRGKRILEIGPGQKLRQTQYFAACNEVIGVDRDEIVRGFDVGGYVRMLRRNGTVRVIKTVGRKLLGVDRSFSRELRRQRPPAGRGQITLLQMDASRLDFPDESFDAVYSYSVFEHLSDPAAVVSEAVRVLRPGGCACISLHLWTSDSGCHDPRIFSKNRAEVPYWPHLRTATAGVVRSNAWLNRWRMDDWNRMFAAQMPGANFEKMQYDNAQLVPELEALRRSGHLVDFADDELLTVDYVAVWRKPGAVVTPRPVPRQSPVYAR